MNFNKAASFLCCLTLIGCSGGFNDGCAGWSGKEITGSGQVKRVGKDVGIVCPDYSYVDISLGVMRNGVGSMSTEDIYLFIDEKDVQVFREASKIGAIVDFTYDDRRMSNCVVNKRMTSFKVQK